MDRISDVHITDFKHSNFIKPLQIHYSQNTISRSQEIVKVHASVSILLFNITRNVLIFVKQFRPAVYYNSIPPHGRQHSIDVEKYPSSLGLTLELCAGIVDKPTSLENIAKAEVLEECGYDVPISALQKLHKFRSAVNHAGDKQTLFYCEVTDAMKVSEGGGNPEEGEFIEVIEMSIPEIRNYIEQEDVLSPIGFLYATHWFLANKASKYE